MIKTHIFLDNSNIFGGAQRVAAEKEKVPSWHCVRVDYSRLFRLLSHGKPLTGLSMLAGSVPPGNDALWDAARDAGFDTTLLKRVENDSGGLVEQAVDEAIHLRISNIILDAAIQRQTPGTIVLATGDGAQTPQGSSFTDQTIRAASMGWNVQIWSWRSQLAKRLRDTRLRFPELVTVFYLDEWYWSIVFVRGGEYYWNDRQFTVQQRSVHGFDMSEGTFSRAKELPV